MLSWLRQRPRRRAAISAGGLLVFVCLLAADACGVLPNGWFATGEWAGADTLGDATTVEVLRQEDAQHLYLGMRFLAERHTGVDLYLTAESGQRYLLHVSSALGEKSWHAGVRSDWCWAENLLWTANAVGMISEDGQSKAVVGDGFEFQIAKGIMPGSQWRAMARLRRPAAVWPAGASEDDPATWVPLSVDPPRVRVHYLGHASFLLTFDDGVTVLTDPGISNAYGLGSPVFAAGDPPPDIVTFSHTHHVDHCLDPEFVREHRLGASRQTGITKSVALAENDSLRTSGLAIAPVRTSELDTNVTDNTSYIYCYRGLTIVHLGDAQANIMACETTPGCEHLRRILPPRIDLLLLTIGGRSDIKRQAAAVLALLRPRVAIPMHFWNRQEKSGFLELLRAQQSAGGGITYEIRETGTAVWSMEGVPGDADRCLVISLEPGPREAVSGDSGAQQDE